MARDSSGRLYAGTLEGLFLSDDNGVTWQVLEDSLKYTDCFAIEYNAGTGYLFIAVESGVYRSNDSGVIWQYLGDEVVGAYSMAIAASWHIWVSGSTGTFVSTNNGDSWTLMHSTIGSFGDGVAVTANGSILESTMLDGLFRTTDNGQNWNFVSGGFTYPNLTVALAASPSNGIVYAADNEIGLAGSQYNVYRSVDDGISWVKIDTGGGQVCDVLYADNKGNLFSNLTPLRRSPDLGVTWESYDNGLPPMTHMTCFIEAADGTLIGGGESIWRINADSGAFVNPPPPPPPCCKNVTGNVNGDLNDAANILDLTALVSYLFKGGSISSCHGENDVDKSGVINIIDITRLVNYLFKLKPLPSCP